MSGLAQAACAALDSLDNEAIVGTIAGDDTIFVVLKDSESAEECAEDFARYIR